MWKQFAEGGRTSSNKGTAGGGGLQGDKVLRERWHRQQVEEGCRGWTQSLPETEALDNQIPSFALSLSFSSSFSGGLIRWKPVFTTQCPPYRLSIQFLLNGRTQVLCAFNFTSTYWFRFVVSLFWRSNAICFFYVPHNYADIVHAWPPPAAWTLNQLIYICMNILILEFELCI